MQARSAQEVTRQRALVPISPTMMAETTEASHSGTALKYSVLEAKLEATDMYEVVCIEHDDIRIWAKDGDNGNGYV